MRVVYVSTLRGGGPVSHLLDLAPAVAAAGADVAVVCASDDVAAAFAARGIATAVAPLEHKLDVARAARLRGLLRGADVVHTQDRRAGLLARTQAPLAGAAVVHTLHGLPEEIAASVGRGRIVVAPGVTRTRVAWLLHGYLRIEALLARLGAVVTVSHAMADFLVEHGLPRGRVHVIPSGIDVRRREPPPPHDPPRIGTTTNLEYWKGVDVLLDACALLERPYRLEVFGDGSQRGELEAQARRLGVAATFHGRVGDVRDRLEELDVFVLPSRAENLPIAILEAMAAALPVVATRVGGVRELVEAELVEPDDPHALARALDALLADAERRRELGAANAARAAADFAPDAVARRTIELYERLVR